MFRKLLFASVALLGLLAPLAMPTGADAHEYHRERHHVHAYRVYYRDPCRPGWVFAGKVDGYKAAVRFADPYRCRGFAISIR